MDPITAVGSPTATTPVTQIGETPANGTLDKDAFLKLLVAQLKYQDPSAPTDVSQMMAQTSQLSMVERLDQIAEGIERLGGGAPLSSASSMLGRDVVFDAGGFEPVSATVEAVRLVDGEVMLSAGGHTVPLEALLEVKGAAAAAPSFTGPTPVAVTVPTTDVATGTDAVDDGELFTVDDQVQ